MTTTTDQTVEASENWKQINAGSPSVTVQLKSPGPILLKIETVKPGDDVLSGFVLGENGENVFAGNALASTDKTFVRSLAPEGEEQTLTVMAT